MIFRLAFLVALVVGLGSLFHLYTVTASLIDVHIVAGFVMLAAIAWLAIDTRSLTVVISGLMVVGAGIMPLLSIHDRLYIRVLHLAIMVVAVGLTEMGVARVRRHRPS